VEFDSRIAHRACGDGQSEALEQREVDVDVEPLGLEGGKRSVMTRKVLRTASRCA